MRLAHEPASSLPMPCASLKTPHESCARSPLVGKKTDRGQRSAFPSDISRFPHLTFAHRVSALPWLVKDRAAFRARRTSCVLPKSPGFPRQSPSPLAYRIHSVSFIKSWMFLGLFLLAKKNEILDFGRDSLYFQVLPWHFQVLPWHRFSEGTKLELGRGAPSKHHPQPTIPPPRPNRPANYDESQLATSLDGESGPTPAAKTFPHSYPKTQVSAGDAYVVCSFLVPACVFCGLPMCLGTPM